MPSLKDVKTKIAGVRKTKQITKAMNMVASAKLRGTQSRIERFRNYADKFHAVLGDIAAKATGTAHPLLAAHAEQRTVLIVLFTSDRGLCGGFNAGLIARALDTARKAAAENKDVRFICVGKKGRDAIGKSGFELAESYTGAMIEFNFDLASTIGKTIIGSYLAEKIDEVILVYGQFESASRQVPTVQPMLPMQQINAGHHEDINPAFEYTYEPDVSSLLNALLPRFVNVQIYRALLDTSASEHAARMVAMDNATRNCDELTGTLTLLYNKTRQASITSELIDIVGGAEALQ
ncbi:MAG: F0F1 ATP synthase subunit gamma [Desulfovibrionaceae bacterium]|nr:F0F1 ATP synthase subunit gamma [Desulfovibrionaceae bacterium]MBO4794356.1 F0F1 ATP synthase subunit gamma [Deltaproteobacteria bacterium]